MSHLFIWCVTLVSSAGSEGLSAIGAGPTVVAIGAGPTRTMYEGNCLYRNTGCHLKQMLST